MSCGSTLLKPDACTSTNISICHWNELLPHNAQITVLLYNAGVFPFICVRNMGTIIHSAAKAFHKVLLNRSFQNECPSSVLPYTQFAPGKLVQIFKKRVEQCFLFLQ